jgi:FkbM family methyltransferase
VDIVRLRPGRDHLRDIASFLTDVNRPVILDVGANHGQTTEAFRKLLRGSEIHSFEPGRDAYRVLEQRAADWHDVRVNHVAVGAATGTLRFRENDQSHNSSFLPIGPEPWGTVGSEAGTIIADYEVPVITVDDYCSEAGIEHVHILKSDTQGYDLEVLKGADTMLKAGRVRLVYTEIIVANIYDGVPSFDEIYRFLLDRRMRMVALYNYFMREDGSAAWFDALFCRAIDENSAG